MMATAVPGPCRPSRGAAAGTGRAGAGERTGRPGLASPGRERGAAAPAPAGARRPGRTSRAGHAALAGHRRLGGIATGARDWPDLTACPGHSGTPGPWHLRGPAGPPGPGRRSPGPGGAGRLSTVSAIRRAQLSEPVLSTFCSWGLALLTVAVKSAPCISDFIIVGMI